jgi:Mn-dependent DtxR family transcriptional regulator
MSHVKGYVKRTAKGKVVLVRDYQNVRMPAKHPESVSHKEDWHKQFNRTHNALLATLDKKSKFYHEDKDKLERHLRTRSLEELEDTYGRVTNVPSKKEIDMATSGNMVKSHVKGHVRQTKGGKVVLVKEHEDTRQAKAATKHAARLSKEADADGSKEKHLAASKAHHEAFKAHRDARDNHKGEDVAGEHFGSMAHHVHADRKHLTAAGVDVWDQPHYHEPEKKGKNGNPDFD